MNNAAAAHAGTHSALLADEGYTGDQDVLDSNPGFLEAQGAMATDRELMMEGLGEKWWILEAAVRYFPSCRYTHGPIDAIRELMQHVLALAALGRTPEPRWYIQENLDDPAVRALASRVQLALDPLLADEALRAVRDTRIGRFPKTRRSLTVRARGTDYTFEGDYASGDPWSPETKPSWERVSQKCDEFCAEILSGDARRRLVSQVRSLHCYSVHGRKDVES